MGHPPFAYDNMGRLVGTTTSYSFLPGRQITTGYSYDAASNRTGFTDPEGGTVAYGYDVLNRMTSLNSSVAGNFGFGYDDLSRRTSLTRPNGVVTNYGYDNLSRLLSVLHQAGGTTTIDGATYTYDNAGNRITKANSQDGSSESYAYDAIYQLQQVTRNGAVSESYTYDPVGNRLSSLGVSPYSYNNSNELTSTPTTTFTYDHNGNTLTKADTNGTTQYGWDVENRLTSVTLPNGAGVVSFTYDPFGRRIERSGPSGTVIYAYDGANGVEELNASGVATARYVEGSGIDEPLARSATALNFYEADVLGSITSMTDSAATVSQIYLYDAYGSLTGSAGQVANAYRYTGREYDQDTGLYYYRARYYDPQIGRFTSQDPIGFASQDTNFYRYVWDSPTNFTDPLGTWGGGVIGGASAGLGLGRGGSSTGSASLGVFGGGNAGVNLGLAGTSGSFLGGENTGWAYPGLPDNGANGVVGAYAGFGGGGFITNATSACQLRGPFDTFTLNFWVGEFQYSSSGSIWTTSLSFGPGVGGGFSYMSTTTAATTLVGRHCGCNP